MTFLPLYIKTEYTLLESLIKIDDLINFAIKNNIKALTITDNNMFGVMDFYQKCIKNNIKPVIGLEVVFEDVNFVLYAKNEIGYHNLIHLTTIMRSTKLTNEDLKKFSSELICIIPFASLKIENIIINSYNDIYYGFKNNNEAKALVNKKIVYINETLYLEKNDYIYYNYLIHIKNGLVLEENNIVNIENSLTLIDNLELSDIAINSNKQILGKCNIEITKENNLLPTFDCPNNYNSFTYLKELCKQGLKNRFGSTVSKTYIDRLKYELEVIEKMEFCDYFLVVYDYVKYAKEHNILVGPGRGSAAGSLVSYVLFITDVDPIKYHLLFERFLNPERTTMPDIDIDFEYTKREEVINYCIEKYGSKKVVGIITFSTMSSKQVIRDVGKIMNINIERIDFISKMLDSKLSLQENINKSKNLESYIKKDKELVRLFQVSKKLEGMKRHSSVHAAGIVMCNKNIDDTIPLEPHDGHFITAYSMEYLEDLGLLKMDFLALKNLTIIQTITESIEGDINFDNIPLDDYKVLDLFKNGNTNGIFQFESKGMINFLRKFQPSSFEDIFAALALFRPGPMNNIDNYINRKNGLEEINYIHPDLENILKPTYGIIVYQEQIMQISSKMAGYSLGEADVLRRAIGKKKHELMIKEKEKFIQKSIARGYSKKDSISVFDLILKFASFGFNRSHSVAYAIIAYKMAYLKVNYPICFMTCLLNINVGSEIDSKNYIYESKMSGIEIKGPNINLSSDRYVILEKKIIYPLSNIKGIGVGTALNIIKEREFNNFTDIFDFIKRVNRKVITKKVLQNLILSGSFDTFGYTRKTLMDNIDILLNYGELVNEIEEEYVLKPVLENTKEYLKKELLEYELDVFGFYLTNHPVTEYKVKYQNCIDLNMTSNFFDKIVFVIGLVDHKREISTKKNEIMCFLDISDEIGKLSVTIFPKIYQSIEEIKIGDIVIVKGRIEKRFDQFQLICSEMNIIK